MFFHEGRHKDRAAVGFNTAVPNWFFSFTDGGSLSAFGLIDQHTKRVLALVIELVTTCPLEISVC